MVCVCVFVFLLAVTPSIKEPLPGWVDNLNGPIGILAAGGKGVLQSVLCNGDYTSEAIPVDFAINAVITIAWKTATTKQKQVERLGNNRGSSAKLRAMKNEIRSSICGFSDIFTVKRHCVGGLLPTDFRAKFAL